MIKRCHPQKGDILLSRITGGILGFSKLVDWDYDFSIYVSLALLSKIQIDSKYLNYYIQSPVYRNDFLSKSLLIASPPKINLSDLESTLINYPNSNEQEKIANFLDLVDKKIELLENKLQAYQGFKKYLMQQIFAQKLRFDYEIVKLKDISKINKGKQLNKDAMIEDGEYYVLNGGQEPSGYTNEWNTPENTITISEGGNSCGFVNFNEEKFWSGGHCYFLSNIQKGDIENFKVQLVSKEDQNKISNLLLSADKKIDSIKSQKENFENFKHGLLQQMFIDWLFDIVNLCSNLGVLS